MNNRSRKPLPHNDDAERALLGAIARHRAALSMRSAALASQVPSYAARWRPRG